PSAERWEGERRRRALSQLLTALPDDEAEGLGLRFLAGLDIEQIGAFVGAPANIVRSRLRGAKRALMEELGQWSEEAGPAVELHPEALRDLERTGALLPAD